jgi:O-antigen biosynthesis protein WbqP
MLIKRLFDITLSALLLAIFAVPLIVIGAAVIITSKGSALYLSDRAGYDNKIFRMYKFRTMRTNTPPLASHLINNPEQYLTPIGLFLRKSSLDELPQLINILLGDMSLVGPRPALFNQEDLIALRTGKGIHMLRPGLTGWAQINGRDDLPVLKKVEFDEYYGQNRTFMFDLRILFTTMLKVLKRDGISH